MVDGIREIDFWVGFRESEGRVLAALQVWKAGCPSEAKGHHNHMSQEKSWPLGRGCMDAS